MLILNLSASLSSTPADQCVVLFARKLIYGSAPLSPSICTVAFPAHVPKTVNFVLGAIPIPSLPLASIRIFSTVVDPLLLSKISLL